MNIESKIVANERCGTVLFVRNLCENELRTLSQKTMCLERKYRVRQLSFHDFVSLYLRQTLWQFGFDICYLQQMQTKSCRHSACNNELKLEHFVLFGVNLVGMIDRFWEKNIDHCTKIRVDRYGVICGMFHMRVQFVKVLPKINRWRAQHIRIVLCGESCTMIWARTWVFVLTKYKWQRSCCQMTTEDAVSSLTGCYNTIWQSV